MNLESLPLPCVQYALEKTIPFNIEVVEFPKPIALFKDLPDLLAGAKAIVRLNDGRLWFVRYSFEQPTSVAPVSKHHAFGPITWHGGAAMAAVKTNSFQLSVNVVRLKPSVTHDEGVMQYRVDIKKNDVVTEKYFFPDLPPAAAKLKTEQEKCNWLAEYFHEAANAKKRIAKQRGAAPIRLPHEHLSVDHYANWRKVMLKMLAERWPTLSLVLKGAQGPATTEDEKQKLFAAYIADYKSNTGRFPNVSEKDTAELWNNNFYISAMARVGPSAKKDTEAVKWKIAAGWLAKGYYQMNEPQFEQAFQKDWQLAKAIKGNTLAKTARRLGLLTALKVGRPEKPNSLPKG